MPAWTHDWGRIIGGLLATLVLLLVGAGGYSWAFSAIIGFLVETYWTWKHNGITLDCIFDFQLMLYGFPLSRFWSGDLLWGIVSLVVLLIVTIILWPHRIPRSAKPGEVIKAEYFLGLQWGPDQSE
jgi:hypothetical protein